MMLHQIQVSWLTNHEVEITWSPLDVFVDTSLYVCFVLRSTAPEGPYTRISADLADTWAFRDQLDFSGRAQEWYYRVGVRRLSDDDVVYYGSGDPREVEAGAMPSGGVAVEAPPSMLVLEARARHAMLLREFVGRRGLWLPRRRWGRMCACMDLELEKPKVDRCLTCYGTRFAGGYMTPVEIGLRLGATPEQDDISVIGRLQPMQNYAELVAYYRPKVGDLIVEAERQRWIVEAVQPYEQLRARTRQILRLSQLPRDNAEYAIPLNWGRDSLTASPSRALLPATDLESYEQAMAARDLQT